MNSKILAKTIALAALEKKAIDLTVLDLRKLFAFTDYFVVCSAASDRQVQTIARSIEEAAQKNKQRIIGMEGFQTGRWVLIDLGDVVAHVFYSADREHYQLEKLWADAPRVKISDSGFSIRDSKKSKKL